MVASVMRVTFWGALATLSLVAAVVRASTMSLSKG